MMRQAMFLCALIMVAIPPAMAKLPPKPKHKPPHDNCTEEIQRGEASWYGPGFEGSLTKSEEVFDPNTLSAAHPSLPFGTILKVVNLRNHKNVVVRVNDRGGFGKARVIDISRAAAVQLDMLNSGTAAVALYRCHK